MGTIKKDEIELEKNDLDFFSDLYMGQKSLLEEYNKFIEKKELYKKVKAKRNCFNDISFDMRPMKFFSDVLIKRGKWKSFNLIQHEDIPELINKLYSSIDLEGCFSKQRTKILDIYHQYESSDMKNFYGLEAFEQKAMELTSPLVASSAIVNSFLNDLLEMYGGEKTINIREPVVNLVLYDAKLFLNFLMGFTGSSEYSHLFSGLELSIDENVKNKVDEILLRPENIKGSLIKSICKESLHDFLLIVAEKIKNKFGQEHELSKLYLEIKTFLSNQSYKQSMNHRFNQVKKYADNYLLLFCLRYKDEGIKALKPIYFLFNSANNPMSSSVNKNFKKKFNLLLGDVKLALLN